MLHENADSRLRSPANFIQFYYNEINETNELLYQQQLCCVLYVQQLTSMQLQYIIMDAARGTPTARATSGASVDSDAASVDESGRRRRMSAVEERAEEERRLRRQLRRAARFTHPQ